MRNKNNCIIGRKKGMCQARNVLMEKVALKMHLADEL